MNAALRWPHTARLLAAEFAKRAPVHDAQGSFAHENFAELHEAGLLTLAAPAAWGGGGAGVGVLSEVVGAIGYGCPATALVLSMQFIQHRNMARSGSAWPVDLARTLVQQAHDSGALVNALRVEPELGSPVRGGVPATVARHTPEGWRLSGHKIYSTGAPALRWLVVWAATDEAQPRMGNFVVPADAPGVEVVPTWDHLGLRASGSDDVLLHDVLVPHSHALKLQPVGTPPAPGDSAYQAEMVALLGALYSGVAQAALDWLVGFLQTRTPTALGAPLATVPRLQEAVGRLAGLLHTNQRLVASLAAQVDAGELVPPLEAGQVKAVVMHNAIAVVQEAVALSSNHGLARRNPLQRHLRDVLCARVHTPQDDSVWLAAGRARLQGAAGV